MKFSEDVVQLINERFPNVDLDKLDELTLDDLKAFKENVEDLRHEYSLLELSQKTAGNAAYGASANGHFYFFNPALAADITGECRNLTETMNNGFEEFFHETLWNRKDLWERFDFELDESKHDWYRNQHVWIYSDTDSIKENSLLLIKRDNNIYAVTIKDLFHNTYINNGVFSYDNSGKEITPSNDQVLNWSKEKGLYFTPIKYVMKHNVSKEQYKIKTKSGKEIIVTGDHSCIVFRNGEQLTIKAKDININTDKILSIK